MRITLDNELCLAPFFITATDGHLDSIIVITADLNGKTIIEVSIN